MPIIAVFFGIVVRVFHDDHEPPHIHVEYAEHRAIVEIRTGRVMAGRLPKRVGRLVEEWRRANARALRRAWNEARSGRLPRRIRPLE